jgi:hypothetical protein
MHIERIVQGTDGVNLLHTIKGGVYRIPEEDLNGIIEHWDKRLRFIAAKRKMGAIDSIPSPIISFISPSHQYGPLTVWAALDHIGGLEEQISENVPAPWAVTFQNRIGMFIDKTTVDKIRQGKETWLAFST